MMKVRKDGAERKSLSREGSKPKAPVMTSMYATQGSIIKEFITNKDNFDETTDRRPALINRYGFIAALVDGFNSDGNRRMEVTLPESADLSLTQNGGFAVFFWFLIQKQAAGVHRFIIKRGNTIDEMTPAIGLLPNGTNLFVKINSSKHKTETLFSNKKLEINRMYSLAITFSIDYQNDLTDISLFLDGLIDSQISVPGEPLHNQGNLYIGKSDSLNHGFCGFVADVLLIPRFLLEHEIFDLHSECLNNLIYYKNFRTYDVFSNKFERENLIERYIKLTGTPENVVENLNLSNDELREIVKKIDKDADYGETEYGSKEVPNQINENKILTKLEEFLENENTEISVICKKLAINSKFIYTVLYLVNSNEDEIDIKRLPGVFEILAETLHFNLEEKSLTKIASILQALTTDSKSINLFTDVKLDYGGTQSHFQGSSQNNFNQNNLEMNSVELHENLLLNSQNFKNFIDDDLERSLAKSSFTIRSLYSRIKSGRPTTGRPVLSSRGEEGDFVNQQFEHFPIQEHKEEDQDHKIILVESPSEIANKDSHVELPQENVIMIEKIKITSELKHENLPVIDEEVKESHIEHDKAEESQKHRNQIVSSHNQGSLKSDELPHHDDYHADEEKIIPHNLISPVSGAVSPKTQTNFDDMVSNFENKVMFKSSDRDTNRFMDPNNIIPVSNIVTSQNFNQQENSKEQQQEENKTEYDPIEPKFPNDWNEGAFELAIGHCLNCHTHKTTTRHFEYTFVDKFNEIGESIKSIFPNIKIVGNIDKPEYFGCFDIYLRGLGPRLDEKGRYFLFRKIQMKRFPSQREICDKLIAMAMLYGSSHNMEAAQSQYMKAYSEFISRPFSKAHDFPHTLSEEGEKEKEELEKMNRKPPKDDPERTKLYCLNSACGITYVQIDNTAHCCTFHPGVFQFGSHHGYWPEAWSCCERPWDAEGCTKGLHKGVRLEKRIMLCVNYGEINPNTNHPDSACGAYYTSADKTCKYHSGRLNGNRWTCCGGEKNNLEGCFETTHQTFDWPEDKAKLNFYPKPLTIPSQHVEIENKRYLVANQITKCDYFKEIKKPYENSATKLELLKMKREKEKDEPRYCVRWGCEKSYKPVDNHHRACRCHPGKWDHGSTGTKMVEFASEFSQDPKTLEKRTILWRPHWTCCGKDWKEPGCKYMNHRGPLLEEFNKGGRQYKWPDPRMKLLFPKIVSDKWKSFLQKYIYPEDIVKQICQKFFSDGRRSLSDLPQLCDKLRLDLLVVSDNIDYQLKFMDIVTGSEVAQKSLVVSGYVDYDRFIKWWFSDYEKLFN